MAAAIASTRGAVEHQPVEEGAGNAGGARLGDILGVCGQNPGLFRAYGIRHSLQGAVFLGGGGERQRAGGEPSLAADAAHQGGNIPCPFNAFQRCTHGRWPKLDVRQVPNTSGSPGRGSPAWAWKRSGDSVDKPPDHGPSQLTYTLGCQGDT